MRKFLLILSVFLVIVFSSLVVNAANLTGQYDTLKVKGGEYIVQNNVWNPAVSKNSQSIQVDENKGSYKIANANFSVPTNGSPGSYPSIYKGNHWGSTTVNSGLPLRVDNIATANTNWSFAPLNTGAWNCSYDVWINKTAKWNLNQSPDGLELMIWLNHNGSIQPIGSKVDTVEVAGAKWDLWFGSPGAWNTASFVRVEKTASCNFDLRSFMDECLKRGYIQSSWYLVGVEAGFEIWQNGTGLESKEFDFKAVQGTNIN